MSSASPAVTSAARTWALAAAGILLAGAMVLHRVTLSSQGRVILQDADAPWIMVNTPVTTQLQQWGSDEAPLARFSTSSTGC